MMEVFIPEVVFTIFGIPIRDTVVFTWIMMAIISLLAYLIGRRIPTGLEMVVDFLNDMIYASMRIFVKTKTIHFHVRFIY